MDVAVQIRLGGGTSRDVTQIADPDQTVQSFINAVCEQNDIPHSREFILSNQDGLVFKMSRKLSSYSNEDDQVFVLTTWTYAGKSKGCSCNQWWLLAVVAFFIGAAGVAAITVIKVNDKSMPDSYGIVFDAGSSHTQMFIYKWEGDKENGTAVASQTYTLRAKGGGISDYAETPSEAGESVKDLIHEARKHIPGSQYSKTELYLGATAGMRLLHEKNRSQSDAIMDSVREALNVSPFMFEDPKKQARIIDGKEEGSFGWVTVNYLDDKFETFPKRDTLGSLDLGGASTQITFVPKADESVDADYQETLLLYGYDYTVYTHSYLCYGSNEAHRQYLAKLVMNSDGSDTVSDPCAPSGNSTTVTYDEVFEAPCTNKLKPANKTDYYTFNGSSDSKECNNVTRSIFNFSQPCDHRQEKCSFNGVFQPALNGKFQAFSQFYYTMAFLNVTHNASLDNFKRATSLFCNKTWQEIKDLVLPASELQYVTHFCFNAHYIDILLTSGYGFNENNWGTISFINKIHGAELGWSLGFVTNTSNTIPAQMPTESMQLALFVLLIVLFVIFIILAAAFACYASKHGTRSTPPGPYSRLGDEP